MLEHRLLIIEMVEIIRKDLPQVGGRKLFFLLEPRFKASSIQIGRDRFFDVLRQYNMLIRKRRKRITTSISPDDLRVYSNLIKKLIVDRPNQLWVSDITYIRTQSGFSFLSIVTDAYSRKIIGFSTDRTLHTTGCLKALEQALRQASKVNLEQLIHHSDRGIQYCSYAYVDILKEHGIQISMSEKGSPQQNTIAERVNGILKHELGLKTTFPSHQAASNAASEAIRKYNRIRPHASCDYLTPELAHQKNGEMKKRWKDYTKKKYPEKQSQN